MRSKPSFSSFHPWIKDLSDLKGSNQMKTLRRPDPMIEAPSETAEAPSEQAEAPRAPTVELRRELADAIAAAEAADRAVEDSRVAVERARSFVSEAEKRLAAATAGVADAKQLFVARTTAAATGDAATSAVSMRGARAAEIDAQDELDACKMALERVKGGRPELEEEARICAHNVVRAVNALLAAAAGPLLLEAEALRVALFQKLAVAWELTATDLEVERRRRWERNVSIRESSADLEATAALGGLKGETEKLVANLLGDLERGQNTFDWKEFPAAKAWAEARRMLMRDPNAPLPPT